MRDGADEVRRVKAEAVAAQREVAGLGEAGEKAGRQLADGLVRGADGRLRDASGRFVKAGEKAGRQFGDGFEKGARPGLAKVAGVLGGGLLSAGGAAPWQGLAAVPAITGAAAAGLQTIPPLLTAIGGGLGAIPAFAVGAAGAINSVKLAVAGLGDAIGEAFEDERDPYLRLSRNGQLFVSSLTAQKQALLDLRSLAQDRVFAGLDAEITSLAAVVLPFAAKQVARFGDTWNATFRQLAALGRDRDLLSGLDSVFEASDSFLDSINRRLPATGRSLAQLFTSSIPFVNQFGESLLEYVDQFNAWINRSAQSGKLEDFFKDAAEQADALLDIGREIFTLVGRIGGLQQDSPLLRNMADALAEFNREAHNMRDIEGIVRTGTAAIEGVVDVLVVLGEVLGDTLADPGTAAAVALFFDVLKAGAQAVGALAQVFGLLPDPMQAVLLAGAGIALVAGRMQGALGRASGALDDLNTRLRATGPAGERAARGLEATRRGAVRAAGALVALQIAGTFLSSTQKSLNPQIDAMSTGLAEFGRTGKLAGESVRVLGQDMQDLSVGLKYIADTDNDRRQTVRWMQDLIETVPVLGDVVRGTDTSLARTRERIAALDESLAHLVSSGNTTAAEAAFQRLAAASAADGVSKEELLKIMPAYAAALEQAKVAGDGEAAAAATAAQKTRLLTGSMKDAITTMGSYKRAWEVLHGAHLSADEAALAAKDALDKVKQAFKENTDTVTGNSRAALENRIAVGEFAAAAAEAAQKKYEETGSITEANEAYDGYIAQLRRTLEQTNLTDAEIEYLLETYAKMPAAKATEVSAPGAVAATQQVEDFNFAIKNVPPSKTVPFWASTDEAVAAVKALKAKINELKDKHIYITGSVRWTSSGDLKVPGGTLLKDRWGGVHEGGYMKAATGILREAEIFGPRSPGRYMIAEPETQGEAFIPKNGDRYRSISIGRRAMEWYGMAVVPKAWITAGRALLAAQAASRQQATAGPAGITVERMEIQAWTDRFSLRQVEQELAMHGAV